MSAIERFMRVTIKYKYLKNMSAFKSLPIKVFKGGIKNNFNLGLV